MESENKILWTELQKKIKDIFSNAKVKKFADILEKDKNGWNWILSFHNLTTDNAIVIHTKFIFKLTEDKMNLRKNDFLYLKDMDCLYKIVSFKDLEDLRNQINEILVQDLFGENMLAISQFMISPAMTMNQHFYDKKLQGYSVFDFQYEPKIAIAPCQELKLEFKFNVNNNDDIDMVIEKIKDEDFKITFYHNKEEVVKHTKSLKNLAAEVSTYIQKNLEKQ